MRGENERSRTRDMLHVQDRNRLQNSQYIYGSSLMTEQELNQYRNRLRNAQTDAEWAQMRAQHQEQMQARARERNVTLQPPVYGQFMMTEREQQRYQNRLRSTARNLRRQAKIRAEHQARMQERAQRLGVELPAPVYGQQLMSAAEQARYRERLRSATNEADRQRLMSQHREQMQERARQSGIPVADLGD